ncbi:MAG: NAD(+) synthase, partial [Desulfobacterales bacterium]|nr:NAD(+) synthase [Desulfobacterales bacterium]
FSMPYNIMDLCLYGKNQGAPPEEVAETVGLTPEQLQRVYEDIEIKRSTTRYLHLPPILIESVPEVKK